MLALRLGLSLGSPRPMGVWNPSDETSLEAWYQKGVGIVLNNDDVESWSDSSTNSHDMVQGTATEQPAYDNGVLTFVAADTNNLQTSSQISLPDEFTIGFKAQPEAYNNVILGDNTTSNEFFKYSNTDRFQVKIDGSLKTFSLDSGSWGNDYIVLTRNGSGLIEFYKNGVRQADTETLAGTADIDAIGVRATDTNPFQGTVEEIQIYTTKNDTLTDNLNAYLSGI